MKPLRTLLFTATFVLTPLAQADDAARIERYVGEALGLGFNPALGVAVVRGDGEVLVDAWGRRDVGFAAPDARTRFYIASATKSLTGTAAATLVAEGNLDLAAPVSEYADVSPPEGLPPQQFSVGALLTHTHGMENDPLVVRTAYSGQHDPALLRELVAQGTTTDSAAFDYSNEGYVIFGLALTELSGGPDWRQGVRQRVLEPLGMSDSTAHLSQVPSDAIAMPFDYRPGDGLERIPLYKSDATLHAAGGHFMSPRDASRWLRANLTHGIIDGQRRLPEEVFAMTQQARVETGSDFGDYRRESYGLGWHRGRYDGDVLVHHFGSFPGYRSHLSFMPERDIGVAVFTNTGGPGFPVVDLVANYAYDVLRGVPDADERGAQRLAEFRDGMAKRLEAYAESLAAREAREWQLSRTIDAYAGRYRSALGTLDVDAHGDKLVFRFGDHSAVATAFERPESVRVELPHGRGQVATFEAEADRVVAITVLDARWVRGE